MQEQWVEKSKLLLRRRRARYDVAPDSGGVNGQSGKEPPARYCDQIN